MSTAFLLNLANVVGAAARPEEPAEGSASVDPRELTIAPGDFDATDKNSWSAGETCRRIATALRDAALERNDARAAGSPLPPPPALRDADADELVDTITDDRDLREFTKHLLRCVFHEVANLARSSHVASPLSGSPRHSRRSGSPGSPRILAAGSPLHTALMRSATSPPPKLTTAAPRSQQSSAPVTPRETSDLIEAARNQRGGKSPSAHGSASNAASNSSANRAVAEAFPVGASNAGNGSTSTKLATTTTTTANGSADGKSVGFSGAPTAAQLLAQQHPGMGLEGTQTDNSESTQSNGLMQSALATSRAMYEADDAGFSTLNQYVLLQELGSGSQGRVFLAMDTEAKAMRAVKEVARPQGAFSVRARLESARHRAQLKREVAIMKRCRHRSIVALYEVIDDPSEDRLFMVMQYIDKGPVCRSVDGRNWTTVDPVKLCDIARQITAGLLYIHQKSVAHRDLKPENLLMDSQGNAYLADFGVSSIVARPEGDDSVANNGKAGSSGAPTPGTNNLSPQSGTLDLKDSHHASGAYGASGNFILPQRQAHVGTIAFQAPELLDSSHGSSGCGSSVITPAQPEAPDYFRADVWSLGITLYVMLYGRLPFDLSNPSDYINSIVERDVPLPKHPEELALETGNAFANFQVLSPQGSVLDDAASPLSQTRQTASSLPPAMAGDGTATGTNRSSDLEPEASCGGNVLSSETSAANVAGSPPAHSVPRVTFSPAHSPSAVGALSGSESESMPTAGGKGFGAQRQNMDLRMAPTPHEGLPGVGVSQASNQTASPSSVPLAAYAANKLRLLLAHMLRRDPQERCSSAQLHALVKRLHRDIERRGDEEFGEQSNFLDAFSRGRRRSSAVPMDGDDDGVITEIRRAAHPPAADHSSSGAHAVAGSFRRRAMHLE